MAETTTTVTIPERIHGFVHEPKLTKNLNEYVAWVLENGEPNLKGSALEAFKSGLYVGIKGYSFYQEAKRTQKSAKVATETAKAGVARKRPAKSAAPSPGESSGTPEGRPLPRRGAKSAA
jgi:hypothetical protein